MQVDWLTFFLILLFVKKIDLTKAWFPGFLIASVVSKKDQAVETIIWKHYGDERDAPGERDHHDCLDRFKFYSDD